jgi:cell division protein FtsB
LTKFPVRLCFPSTYSGLEKEKNQGPGVFAVKFNVKESTKIIAALFGAFMITMVAHFLFGPKGTFALEELAAYQTELSENLKDLENIQAQLKVRFEQLKSNRRVLSLEARDLGIFRPGERVMRLVGLKQDVPFSFEGSILRHKADVGMSEEVFRLVGLITALVLYGLLTIVNILFFTGMKGKKAAAVKKTPVYQYF